VLLLELAWEERKWWSSDAENLKWEVMDWKGFFACERVDERLSGLVTHSFLVRCWHKVQECVSGKVSHMRVGGRDHEGEKEWEGV
jgi:hypothetical protein